MKPVAIKALLLAAGRGERMRPLTDACPKPLLLVRGKPLLQWPLEALARGGVSHVVINTAWLGHQISDQLGPVFVPPPSGPAGSPREQPWPVQIDYSHEGQDFGGALETAGGIARALPLLCPDEPSGHRNELFWVLAGDVFAPDFVFGQSAIDRFVASDKLAHLWLVPNPAHNSSGDFGLTVDPGAAAGIGLALNLPLEDPRPRYTFSTIGLYRRQLFAPPWCDIAPGNPQGCRAALAPLLRAAMDQGRVSAELYRGAWTDVGTPARLQSLNQTSGTAK